MMYPWNNSALENTMPYISTICKKEVHKLFDNILNYLSIGSVSVTLYESEGRAFESLRVRHSQPILEDFKNGFVPLIGVCTSFLCSIPSASMKSISPTRSCRMMSLPKLWQGWQRMLNWNPQRIKLDGPRPEALGFKAACYNSEVFNG